MTNPPFEVPEDSWTEDEKQNFRDAVAIITAAFSDDTVYREILSEINPVDATAGLISLLVAVLTWMFSNTGIAPDGVIQMLAAQVENL